MKMFHLTQSLYGLQSYKNSWKSTHNHFQRYSDVKPREERKPTVVDLANQAHVVQKVNGWKIYHLSSQMEDLVSQSKTNHRKSNHVKINVILMFVYGISTDGTGVTSL